MFRRFCLASGALAFALAASGCSNGDDSASQAAALKWAEKISEELTNRAQLTSTTPAKLSHQSLSEVKDNLAWKADLTLQLLPGHIQVTLDDADACVTLAGGLFTKSPVAKGQCPEDATAAPLIEESEQQGNAIAALQLWVATASDDPAWKRLTSVEDVQSYIANHLTTPKKGVVLDQPTPNRVRASFGSTSWCATFWMLTTGLGTKLESCSVKSPIPKTGP